MASNLNSLIFQLTERVARSLCDAKLFVVDCYCCVRDHRVDEFETSPTRDVEITICELKSP